MNNMLRHGLRLQSNHQLPAPVRRMIQMTTRQPPGAAAARHQLRLFTTGRVPPILITTPIYYCNADPHIGHLYSSIVADTFGRYYRLAKYPTRVSTGTDEHGSKVLEAANKAEAPSVQTYTDQISEKFKKAMTEFDVSYDAFVRTTSPKHKATVEWMWRRLTERGCIYKGSHTGWYCRSEEAFIPASQVTQDEQGNHVIKDRPWQTVEHMSEENYKFRLSLFKAPILKWIEGASFKEVQADTEEIIRNMSENLPNKYKQDEICRNPNVDKSWENLALLLGDDSDKESPIVPYSRSNELRSILENELEDLSVSRLSSKVEWGIRVPNDPNHTVYVWLDALANYLTVSSFLEEFEPEDSSNHSEPCVSDSVDMWWPCHTHVIGKDILKFHCVYWPAFLLAAGLPLPKRVLIHGHWLSDGRKMSKSLGNVVDLNDLKEQYSIDSIRYFLLREGRFDQDGNIHKENVDRRAVGDCADTLGNLAARSLSPVLLPNQVLPAPGKLDDDERSLVERANSLLPSVHISFKEANISLALESIMDVVSEVNRYFAIQEPWNLRPGKVNQNQEKLDTVLWLTLETLRVCGILLQPAMPTSMQRLLDYLGVPQTERDLSFAQIDMEGRNIQNPVGVSLGYNKKLILFEKKR